MAHQQNRGHAFPVRCVTARHLGHHHHHNHHHRHRHTHPCFGWTFSNATLESPMRPPFSDRTHPHTLLLDVAPALPHSFSQTFHNSPLSRHPLLAVFPSSRVAFPVLVAGRGEAELLVLGAHFKVEVAVINCESLSVLVYGSGSAVKGRIYVLYTGQHYDPVVGIPDACSDDLSSDLEGKIIAVSTARAQHEHPPLARGLRPPIGPPPPSRARAPPPLPTAAPRRLPLSSGV